MSLPQCPGSKDPLIALATSESKAVQPSQNRAAALWLEEPIENFSNLEVSSGKSVS